MNEYHLWIQGRIRSAREHVSRLRRNRPDDHVAIARELGYIRRLEALDKRAQKGDTK